MYAVKLKDLKKGTEFRRKPDAHTVYIRGEFIREDRFNKYACEDWSDHCREVFLKGDTVVWTGFDW